MIFYGRFQLNKKGGCNERKQAERNQWPGGNRNQYQRTPSWRYRSHTVGASSLGVASAEDAFTRIDLRAAKRDEAKVVSVILRRTFLALAGASGVLSAPSSNNANATEESGRYDVYPSDSDREIQATLNDLSVVEAAPGDYHYTRDLAIPDYTTLRGAGEGRTTFFAHGPYSFVDGDAPTSDVTVEDLTIDIQNNGVNAIKFWGARETTLRNVEARNAGTRDDDSNAGGIHVRTDSADDAGRITVENCTVRNASAVSIDLGGRADAAVARVTGCRILDPNPSNRFTHGISVEDVDRAIVDECYVNGGSDYGALVAYNLNASSHSRLSDSIAYRGSNAVNIANAAARRTAITDCTFAKQTGDAVRMQVDGVRKNVIRDNVFTNVGRVAYLHNGGWADFVGNDIDGYDRGLEHWHADASVTVANNTFRGGPRDGVAIALGKADSNIDPVRYYSTVANNRLETGYCTLKRPAHVYGNTIMGTWGSDEGGSIQVFDAAAESTVQGNWLWGRLAVPDETITYDNLQYGHRLRNGVDGSPVIG